MKNILLPTDFSENSWNAIAYALNFFQNTPCTFYLLHVNALSYVAASNTDYSNDAVFVEQTFTKPAKKRLKTLIARIASEFPQHKNHHFFALTDYNFFVDAVRKRVLEKKIDLIVMGTKGASGLKKVIVGSNAADVIKKVKCPTLVVPENARFENLKEIAFPTDYYLTYGVDLLNPLYQILNMHQSSLQIIHITNDTEDLCVAQQDNKDLLNDYFNKFKIKFYNIANKNVETAIEEFVEEKNITLVAMVAKNLNYFQRILFHSKVEEITYHTRIPFLVMHNKTA